MRNDIMSRNEGLRSLPIAQPFYLCRESNATRNAPPVRANPNPHTNTANVGRLAFALLYPLAVHPIEKPDQKIITFQKVK